MVHSGKTISFRMPPGDKLEGTFRPDDKPKVSRLSTMLLGKET